MVDEFIGQKFGSLTVIGIAGRNKHSQKEYACHCSECSKDPELFGDAIFESVKDRIVRGALPCGCARNPRWTVDQYRVLIKRKAAGQYTAIVPDNVKVHDKVQCICAVDGCGHEWTTSINDLLHNSTACPKCAAKVKGESMAMPESVATETILKICSEKGWTFHGFKNDWKNIRSKLILECHCGHQWSPAFYSIVYNDIGCSKCAKHGYNPGIRGWLYCHIWTNPEGHQFLKYGITNYPTNRIKQQSRNTEYAATEIFSIAFEDGSVPERLEKAIDEYRKTNNIANPVSKDLFPDGFSETLPISAWSFIRDLIQNETMCKLHPL